jgi:hypothetical protein
MRKTITIADVREIKPGGTSSVLENENHLKAEALIKFMRSKPENVVISETPFDTPTSSEANALIEHFKNIAA